MRLARPSAFALCLMLLLSGHAHAQLVDDIAHNNALTHYRAGEDLMRNERFANARDEFQQAIKFDPLLTIAHYELGQTFMALRQYQEAIRAYVGCRTAYQSLAALISHNDFVADQRRDDEIRELRQSIDDIQSGRIRISTGRDVMVARLEHRISELERTKQTGRSSFETPPELSLALGSAYFRSGNMVQAEREWKDAVDGNAKLGEAYNNLAALYAMTGRKAEAQDSVKSAERAGFKVNPNLKSDIQKMP